MSGTTAYKNEWQKNNAERINLVVKKGYKDKARQAADSIGMSLNGFIISAIDTKIKQVDASASADKTAAQNSGNK